MSSKIQQYTDFGQYSGALSEGPRESVGGHGDFLTKFITIIVVYGYVT